MSEIIKSKSYRDLLTEIKQRIQESQIKTVISVNQQLLFLYWEIGKDILVRQQRSEWGAKVIDQLSIDLKKEFPSLKGFSKSNLKYMQQFASTYPNFSIGQAPLGQISWYHNITLLQKCSNNDQRFWYAQKSIEHGWSRNMMVHHIESHLYKREGKALTNFSRTLPAPKSELAQQTLKDPYIFDFLTLDKDAREKDLEDALMKHITKFLLELGAGFAFLGRQYRITVDDDDYSLDLLFYHIKLRCYIVIDLKIGRFKPSYVGQMNFYLSALDDIIKDKTDNPSIGLILCKDKKKITVEYALRDISKPIGIAEYRLTEAIPQNLKSNLPSIEELEQELLDVEQSEKDGDIPV